MHDVCRAWPASRRRAVGARTRRRRGTGPHRGLGQVRGRTQSTLAHWPTANRMRVGEPVIAGGPSRQKVPQHLADEPGDGNVPRPKLRAGMGAESRAAQTKAGDASSADGQAPFPRGAWGAGVGGTSCVQQGECPAKRPVLRKGHDGSPRKRLRPPCSSPAVLGGEHGYSSSFALYEISTPYLEILRGST
jgi:hypothetical protein